MKAMILAAGLGTRLKPWTDEHPKALAPVNGKSLLQRNILYLQQYGIKEVVVNVHHFADQIIEAVEANHGWGSKIIISDETDVVLETGGGLKKAAPYFKGDEHMVLMNADILTNMQLDQMIQQHKETGALATLAVSQRTSSRYFLFGEDSQLKGWKHEGTGEVKPAGLDITGLHKRAFSGIHVIQQALFSKINQTGKFSMVDVYLALCDTEHIYGFDHTGALLLDVGKPESLTKAANLFP
jgi:N-acetyl-alpha-D-muramate 1-phosphate uridylyltransferase